MTDQKVIGEICDYAKVDGDDVVLEIGAGTGNLTSELVKRAKLVYGIERDQELTCILNNKLLKKKFNQKIKIIHGDALKVPFPRFNKAVSNIPYSISRKITLKLLKHKFDLSVLVYQKEFAEKLIAAPKTREYRAISVIVQCCAEVEILKELSPAVFSPRPRVKSAITRITPKSRITDEFIEFVYSLFSHRNKKIKGVGKRPFELNPGEFLKLYH